MRFFVDRRHFVLFACALGLARAGWADATVEVAANGTQADIVDALAAVDDNGTVLLLGSEYTLSSALAISRGVTLKGQGRDATVLKGDSAKHTGVTLSHASAVLCDLTVQGFTGSSTTGTGVYMTKGTVRNCRIRNNKCSVASAKGVGVYMKDGALVNVILENNQCLAESGSQHGAGLYMESGWAEGCLVTGGNISWGFSNFAQYAPSYYGGGVAMKGGTLVNSTICDNKSFGRGGGLYIEGTTARVYNSIIAGNVCDKRAAAVELDVVPASATNYLSHCIVGGGSSDQYPGLGGWCGLDTDYKPTEHSAGVAAGDATLSFKSATDLAGNPRVHDDVADIGAYAYTASLAKCGIGANCQRALVGKTVTLTAYVHTATAPASYAWTVTAPDSTETALSGRNPTVTLSQVGTYGLSLTAGGETTTRTDWLTSVPLTNTVAKTQSIHDAVAAAADGQVISLPDNLYSVSSAVTIRADIHILGAGYTNTVVRNTTSSVGVWRVFDIDSPGAVVEGVQAEKGIFKGSQGNYNMGTGVRIGLLGGTMLFCRVTGNSSGATYSYGGGVVLRGEKAVLRDTIVDSNSGVLVGGGVYVENGLVDSCLIRANTLKNVSTTKVTGGGLAFASDKGVVRNTIIARNTSVGASTSDGGGLYFCGAAGAGQVVNCILFGNTASAKGTDGGYDWSMATAASVDAVFSNCAFDSALAAVGSDGVLITSAVFTDYANNDFHHVGSTCVNKGATYDGIATLRDLDGNPRLFGDKPDIGCYESQSTLFEPSFTVSPTKVRKGGSVTLTPDLTGAPSGNLVCRWIFSGDAGNVFTNTSSVSETPSVALATGGLYDITLDVIDTDTEKSVSKSFTIKEAALSSPLTNYVTSVIASAHPVSPFEDPTTASTNLNDVVEKYAMEGNVVILDAGTHILRRTLALSDAITVRGAGMDATRLVPSDGYSQLTRSVTVNHENAVVERLTVANATLANGSEAYNRVGSVMLVDQNGGTIRECMVTNTCCLTIYQNGIAIGCTSAKGRVSRCKIVGNCMNLMQYTGSSTVYVSAGQIDDCLVVGNSCDGVAGIVATGSAKIWNCTVTGNVSTNSTGLVDAGGLSVNSASCLIYNCLFAGNVGKAPKAAYAPEATYAAESLLTGTDVLRNCLFKFDDPSTAVGYKCRNADPKFVDPAHRNYRLSKDTPCRRGGQRGDWMTGALDLYGNPRCNGPARADIGCEQLPPCGLVLFTR